MATKKCSKCAAVKALEEFNLCRGKYRSQCKKCHSASVVEWQRANKDKKRAKQIRYLDRHFPNRRKYVPIPLDVQRAKARARRQRWLEKNKDRMDLCRANWLRNNPHKVAERTRRYQIAKKRAVPGWADRRAMAEIYAEARRLTGETGIRHEVDHIVPITSDVVCGLHWEGNLRVIPMSANRSKSNRLIA